MTWSTKDEAYSAGRDLGFDRGYEEGFDAARRELAGRRIRPSTPPPNQRAERPTSPRRSSARIVRASVLVALAYGAWRLLRTWPGRLLVVGSIFALSGLISAGVVVLAVIVGALVLAWAVRTVDHAVRDVRTGAATVRAVARDVGGRRKEAA